MRVPVWDLPVRAFHWTLAVLVVFSFVSGQLAGAWLPWHFRSGYTILALVLARVAWGFVGSDTALFRSFLWGPAAIRRYARALLSGDHPLVIGHNPMGGWMVLVMLLAILTQVVSGLFTDDEIASKGPLADMVSSAVVSKMGALHHYNQWTLVALVGLHVTAITLYHRVLHVNLIGPMWHGMAPIPPALRPPRQHSIVRAAILLALAAAFVYGLVMILPRAAS
jgi:cytochrome b